MDIHGLMNALSAAAADIRKDYHLTLGGLIAALEDVSPTTPVRFDNGKFPGIPRSYRGYYSDLAMRPDDGPTDAREVLERARDAVGKTYQGYKGGDFTMDEDTPLWMADYGECGPAIVGAHMADGVLILTTKDID